MVSKIKNTDLVSVNGFKVAVHPYKEYISEQLRQYGGYEQEYLVLLTSQITPGSTVIDIGANIGLHTLHFSRAVGPKGKVLSFEPDPTNFELLSINVKNNHCTNVNIYPYALGEVNQLRKFFLCTRNKGKQSFTDLDNLNDSIDVTVRKASEFPDFHHASVVKIDVEGAEPLVYKGFDGIKPPQIFFEFTISQLLALNNDPLSFLNQLQTDGYSLFVTEGRENLPIVAQDFVILATSTNKDYNLLAKLK